MKNSKGGTNNVIRDEKAKRKVRIKHFNVNRRGTYYYVRASRGYHENIRLLFRGFKVPVEVTDQQATFRFKCSEIWQHANKLQ